jgi:hypothetical protein
VDVPHRRQRRRTAWVDARGHLQKRAETASCLRTLAQLGCGQPVATRLRRSGGGCSSGAALSPAAHCVESTEHPLQRHGPARGVPLIPSQEGGPPRANLRPSPARRPSLRRDDASQGTLRLAVEAGLPLTGAEEHAPPRHREDGQRENHERPLAKRPAGRARREGRPLHVRQGFRRGALHHEGHRQAGQP